MSRKGGATQKGNSISANQHQGRTTTKTATELSSPAKVARPPPSVTSASSRAKMWQYALQQVASKSTSNLTGGRSFGDKETKRVSSSSETNISSYDDQSIARTSTINQLGPRNKASRQSEQRQDSSASLFQTAAANDRVKLHQPDQKLNGPSAKSAVARTLEKKAVSNFRKSRDSLAKGSSDNYKDVDVQNSGNELCKHCRSSMRESVCFISNDGRIAAIRTGASVLHLHVCDSPRCAANPNYKPSSKKFLVSQRQSLPSQFAKNKSSAPSCLGRMGSSTNSSLHGHDSRRHSVALPFPITREGDNEAEELSHSGSTSTVDQNIDGEDERSHNPGAELLCATSIQDQNGCNSYGLSPYNNDPSSNFVRDSKDEQRARWSDGESGSECCTPMAHDNSASIIGSQDQKSSRPTAGVLESGCCAPVSQGKEQSASFTRDFENEQSRGGSSNRFGSEGAVLVDEFSTSINGSKDQKTSTSSVRAHENSGSNDESRDQKFSSNETGELDSGCSTPTGRDKVATSSFMRDYEDERSCGGSNTGFGSECSTPTLANENSVAICSSEDHDQKRCRAEDGDLESCCSTPLGYDNGQSGTCGSFYHQGDDELSCSDDDREGTIRDGTISTLSTSPGSPNTSFEQSSNKLQRKKSSVSRLRRNYLNMLKQQEAETVRLRKQEIQKRKQAGDWMLDCAIEEVLHRLAPSGETRVKVLVEAFETVMSHSDSEIHPHPMMHF